MIAHIAEEYNVINLSSAGCASWTRLEPSRDAYQVEPMSAASFNIQLLIQANVANLPMAELLIRLYIFPLFIIYWRIPIHISFSNSYLVIGWLLIAAAFANAAYEKDSEWKTKK